MASAPPPPPREADEGGRLHGDITSVCSIPAVDYDILNQAARTYTGQAGWMFSVAERYTSQQQELVRPREQQVEGSLPKARAKPSAIRHQKAIATSVQPGFAQSKQVFYVNGRPTVVYRLRHEGSQPEEDIPYLSSVFSPCPIMAVSGRSADLAPQVARRQAVWNAWEAALLPLITSPQTPPDTIFFVCESDFCMSPDHNMCCDAYLTHEQEIAWAGPNVQATELEERSASSSAGPALAKGAPKGVGKLSQEPEEPMRWWQKTHPTPVPGQFQNANRLLQGMVGLVTAAARFRRGGLVWISWCPKNDKNQPANGTTCVAITKRAATLLETLMKGASVQPTHFDVWLKNMLKDPKTEREQELANMSCYVVSPVAGYRSHLSGCEKNLQRKCDWKLCQSWPEIGGKGKTRWYCKFGKGNVQSRKIGNVPDNLWALEWKTYLPSRMRNADGQPDQDKLDKVLGPPGGLVKRTTAKGASVQPTLETEPSTVAGAGRAGSSADAPMAALLDAPTTGVEAEPAQEEADWETCSVMSVLTDNAGLSDKDAGDNTEPDEPKRKRRTMPVDQQGMDEQMETTRHRLRQRRKAARAYFQFRIFTDKQDRICFDVRVCHIVSHAQAQCQEYRGPFFLNKELVSHYSAQWTSVQPPQIVLASALHNTPLFVIYCMKQ